ncbi:hypothetical protein FIU86_00770 [Roseovarius sp. THAF9]|nr:hypothetical protein FIU86_00770 [Roseovarius sp. THAF9]
MYFQDFTKERELPGDDAVVIPEIDNVVAGALMKGKFEILAHRQARPSIDVADPWILRFGYNLLGFID